MAIKLLRDGRWTVYYKGRDGRKKWEYFGRGSKGKRDAQARDFEIKSRKKRGEDVTSGQPQHSLPDLCQAYLDHLRTKGTSYKFRKELAQTLSNHIFPILGNISPDQINDSDLAKVAEYYQGRGVSQSTINRYFRYLRTIFRYGVARGYIAQNPLQHWQSPKEPPRRLRLTVEGLQQLIDHAEPHLAWALEVLWNLGCRPGTSELTSIRWDQVDFDRSKVWIWGRKTGMWRDVPVSHPFLVRLNEQYRRARTEYVIEYNGRPINKFRRSVKTAAKRAGLHESLCLYEVRHLFATVMIQGGGDLAAVSRLLGHASTHMTADVYYGYLSGEKERAVGLLPEVKRDEKEGGKKVVNLNEWKGKKK